MTIVHVHPASQQIDSISGARSSKRQKSVVLTRDKVSIKVPAKAKLQKLTLSPWVTTKKTLYDTILKRNFSTIPDWLYWGLPGGISKAGNPLTQPPKPFFEYQVSTS